MKCRIFSVHFPLAHCKAHRHRRYASHPHPRPPYAHPCPYGSIDLHELTNGFQILGLEMTDEQLSEFHRFCDFDGTFVYLLYLHVFDASAIIRWSLWRLAQLARMYSAKCPISLHRKLLTLLPTASVLPYFHLETNKQNPILPVRRRSRAGDGSISIVEWRGAIREAQRAYLTTAEVQKREISSDGCA